MATTEKAPPGLMHLWLSSAYFITPAFIAFNVFDSQGWGWGLMAASLLGPFAAAVWGAVRREWPGPFVIFPLGAVALISVLFGLTKGFSWS
ncbi:hypothetical protein [Streptomyces sp. H34-S4]|uniref:hypothetical protein n=1 Tax=Streptomyces sp. H34-S4 TaxID=2996463 RepID=UPI00226E515E|nr:hypothetical protein [Streptomyces sp. H34-S4]MCY0933340.1 hypothetical protein [Streptomyces sp. H34-S4]